MRFYSLPTPERLVEEAFTYARRRMPGKRLRTSTIQNRKAKVILKMELFIEYLDKQLHRMIISVPTFKDLHPFYQELLPETVNIVKVKQSVSQMVAVRKLLKKQLVQGRQRMHLTSPDALKQMDKASKSFFGRVANIMDSLGESVAIMNKANQLMKEVPDIRTDIPTIVLAGYPNTGKTTLLGRLTGSKARIASFPFTTKSLQLGYFQWKYHDIQVIDTPGLLDRPPEKRNPIEKKAMAALHHVANAILFVIDPTPTSGYPLAQQHALLMSLQKQFSLPFLLILNKTDAAAPADIKSTKDIFGDTLIEEGEGIPSPLRERVGKVLGLGV